MSNRVSTRRGTLLLPNMLTICALACGLSAIRFAADGRLMTALGLVLGAAIFDMVDGRVARMLDAQSKMGAELDSLSDALCFGATPALIIYFSIFSPLSASPSWATAGWLTSLLFTACIVLRLARFNTLLDNPNEPAFAKEFFVGVPAPAAALLALIPLVALAEHGAGWWTQSVGVSLWLLVCGALAISRIPTLSFKKLPPVKARYVAPLLIVTAGVVATFLFFPSIVLASVAALYLAHIPFAAKTFAWLSDNPQLWEAPHGIRREIRRSERISKRRIRRPARRTNNRRVAGRR